MSDPIRAVVSDTVISTNNSQLLDELAAEDSGASTSPASVSGFFGRDLIYTLLWASQMGLSVALTAVVTRILGPDEYGISAACITIMQVVSAVAGFGLQIGIQRAHASRGDEAARQLVLLAFITSGIIYLVVASTVGLWSGAIGLEHSNGAVDFAVLWAALSAVTAATLGLVRSRDQLGVFALINILQTGAAELLSLVLIIAVAHTARDYILGEMLAQAVAAIVGLMATRPLGLAKADLSLVTDTLRFCVPLVPQMVAMFVLSASGRLVVNAVAGPHALGRYAVVANLASIPLILITSLASSWMPRVFSLSVSGDVNGALRQTRDLLYLLLVPLVCVIGVASPLLLRLWAPSSFRPDGLQLEVALIVAAAIPFAGTTTHERMLVAHDQTRANAVATGVAAAVNLGLNIVLVRTWGILGAAIATLVSFCVMDVMLWLASSRIQPLPHPRPLVIAWIVGGLALLFGAVLLPTSVPVLIIRGAVAVIAGMVALVILWVSGAGDRRGPDGLRRFARWLAARASLEL